MITDKDSLGNQLTKEQIEYFKDSKVVDSHNNLLVCYHGSPNAGFREFDPRSKKSRFGLYKFGDANVNYFTTDKSSASSYTDMGYDDGTVYQVYLNITNPYIVDNKSEAEIKSFLNIKDNTLRDKQVRLFDRIFNKWKGKIIDYSDYRFNELNKDLHKLNLELKPNEVYEEGTDPMDIDLFDLWNLGKNSAFGSPYIIEYQYYTDELFSDEMYDELKEQIIGEVDDYFFSTDEIVKLVLTMNEEDGTNYDGIIIKDIMDSTSMFSNIATDYITLQSSNQIKDITNKTPSSSNNIDEKLDEAWTPEEQKERRLLWKSPTYTKDPKPNTTRLVHQTDKNNIQSILRNGLLGSKRRPFDNPNEDVIWAGEEMPFDSMWNYGNCAIEFDLPNDFDFRPVNGSDYQIYQDIPPKYFNAIYLASPYRKEIMKDFQNTLDIDKSIDRFQQGLLTEILHIDYKKMFGSSSLQESQEKTYYVPQEYKDLLVNDAKRYGWLDGENSYEFKVLSLEKIMEANKLKNNPNHGMFYRRADRWGTDPNEYHYTPSKEDWLYSPIRVRGDYRIIDGGHRLYALYNDGYDYVEVLVPKGSLFESLSLTEASRNDLISKAKRGKEYKDKSKGRNRWERKKYSRVASTTKEYNSIDMNTFFKKDILTITIPIRGETDNYTVRVKFGGALKEIQNTVKRNNNRLDYKSISQALVRCFNGENVYVRCNCLHPSTEIKLLDGTVSTIEDMKTRFDNGEKLYVYSVDEKGDFVPGEVKDVWVSGEATEFTKVTLDNGEEIITTPEHRYLRRDGTYDEAQNLKAGDSLMPLYFSDTNGYELVKPNSKQGWNSVYKEVASYYKSSEIEEANIRAQEKENNLGYNVAIHHKDFNKRNNNPENLQIMTAQEHWDYHNSLSFNNKPKEMQEHIKECAREHIKKLNANPTPKMLECRAEFLRKGRLRNYDQDRREQQSQLMKQTMKEYYANLSKEEISELRKNKCTQEWRDNIARAHRQLWENMSEEEYKRRCDINKQSNAKSKELRSQRGKEVRQRKTEEELKEWASNSGKGISKAWKEHREKFMTQKRYDADARRGAYERTAETNNKTNITKIEKVISLMLKDNLPITEEMFEKVRKSLPQGYPKYTKVFDTWEDVVKYFHLNHKVVKVETIYLEPTPVYDLSIQGQPNFLTNAGVILHNCEDFTYRFNYWAEKNGFSADTKREVAPYQNQFEWTNKYDDMGGICKHVALVISNTFWLMKVASVINNYIHYAETYMQRQFADIIFPKIYGVKYPDAVQLGLFDRQYLKHSKGVIDEINNYGKGRGRFKKKPQPEQKEVEFRTHPKQLTIFDVKEEDDVEKKPSFKKQTIYDYGVEETETEEEAKPKFKPQNSKQPTLNKGYKQLSLFDEEEE